MGGGEGGVVLVPVCCHLGVTCGRWVLLVGVGCPLWVLGIVCGRWVVCRLWVVGVGAPSCVVHLVLPHAILVGCDVVVGHGVVVGSEVMVACCRGFGSQLV